MDKIIAFFKKQSIAFYLSIAAFIVTLVAVCIYGANSNDGKYYNDFKAGIVIYSVFAMLIIAAAAVLPQFFGKKWYFDALPLIVVALLCVIITSSVGGRIESLAIILASDLEAGNTAAQSAVNQFFVCVGFYAAGIILTVLTAFFKQTKSAKKAA